MNWLCPHQSALSRVASQRPEPDSGSAVLCRCDLPEIVSARIEAHCCDRSADRLSQPGHECAEGMSQKNTSLWTQAVSTDGSHSPAARRNARR